MAVALLLLPHASSAAEVGNGCVANATEKNQIALPLASASDPLPLTVPAPGVVTRWRIQVAPGLPGYLPQRLIAFRPTGRANEFLTVDSSETKLVKEGFNEFGARIPVRAGDRLGLGGYEGTYLCSGATGDSSGLSEGEARIGKSRLFRVETDLGTPVTAIVEPDVDHDGFGDERQDKCPQSAAYHRDACSPVKLRLRARARKRSILVRVRADMEVSLQVFGQVGWGFKPKGKPGAGHPRKANLIVGLQGSTKHLLPGRVATFRMALPRPVTRRLNRITPQESLKAEITARATDLDGALAERRRIVRLKGWDRG
jgi:hypothetical protein